MRRLGILLAGLVLVLVLAGIFSAEYAVVKIGPIPFVAGTGPLLPLGSLLLFVGLAIYSLSSGGGAVVVVGPFPVVVSGRNKIQLLLLSLGLALLILFLILTLS